MDELRKLFLNMLEEGDGGLEGGSEDWGTVGLGSGPQNPFEAADRAEEAAEREGKGLGVCCM